MALRVSPSPQRRSSSRLRTAGRPSHKLVLECPGKENAVAQLEGERSSDHEFELPTLRPRRLASLSICPRKRPAAPLGNDAKAPSPRTPATRSATPSSLKPPPTKQTTKRTKRTETEPAAPSIDTRQDALDPGPDAITGLKVPDEGAGQTGAKPAHDTALALQPADAHMSLKVPDGNLRPSSLPCVEHELTAGEPPEDMQLSAQRSLSLAEKYVIHLNTADSPIYGPGQMVRGPDAVSPVLAACTQSVEKQLLDFEKLAMQLSNNGQEDKALAILRQSLDSSLQMLGQTHEYTSHMLHILGCLLFKQGRLNEARPCLENALALRRDWSTNHSSVDELLSTMNCLGALLLEIDLLSAEPLLEETVDKAKATQPSYAEAGHDNALTVTALFNLAKLQQLSGDFESSIRTSTEACSNQHRESILLSAAQESSLYQDPIALLLHIAGVETAPVMSREYFNEVLPCETPPAQRRPSKKKMHWREKRRLKDATNLANKYGLQTPCNSSQAYHIFDWVKVNHPRVLLPAYKHSKPVQCEADQTIALVPVNAEEQQQGEEEEELVALVACDSTKVLNSSTPSQLMPPPAARPPTRRGT